MNLTNILHAYLVLTSAKNPTKRQNSNFYTLTFCSFLSTTFKYKKIAQDRHTSLFAAKYKNKTNQNSPVNSSSTSSVDQIP